MSDVVFINPPGMVPAVQYPTNRPPYDLLYMESYLYHKKIKTLFLDLENQKIPRMTFRDVIASRPARYYVINTTGKSHHFRFFLKEDLYIKNIISDIRNISQSSVIILTGETSKIYTQEYFSSDANCILYDEPEYSLYEIVTKQAQSPSQFMEITGIYFNAGQKFLKNRPRDSMQSLDELTPPQWKNLGGYFWDSTYKEKEKFIDLPGMRGCPYRCTFCKSSLARKVLYHSPEYLLEQITRLHREFGYEDFFIRDAGYFDHPEHYVKLCQGLKNLKKLTWKCNARVDTMNKEKLTLMKESGCSLISYGAESGNDRTLKEVCKGISTQDIINTIALTRTAGIQAAVYFLLGLPSETFKEQLRTLFFAKKLNPDIIYISKFQPLEKHYAKTAFKTTPRKTFQEVIKMIFALFIFFKRNKIVYYKKIRIDTLWVNKRHLKIWRIKTYRHKTFLQH